MILEHFIYEEEINSYETELIMERALYESMLSVDMAYYESANMSTTDKITSLIKRAIEAFKAFMVKCRDYLKSAVKMLTGRVTEAYTEYTVRDVVANFDSYIVNAEKSGMKTFTFFDVKAIVRCLNDECDDYIKAIKNFQRAYIKRGAPKDAEKMLAKFDEIAEKHGAKLQEIINTKKTYSIREAKHIAHMINNSRSVKRGGFIDVVDRFDTVCDEIETLTINTLNSLDKYSEDTGYIQNAKTLQQMIHNGCVRMKVHAGECVTALLTIGIPLMCHIDKLAHTKTVDTGAVTDEGLKIYVHKDTSSADRKYNRKLIESISSTAGNLSSANLKSLRKITRKNDLKDWEFTKGESPLSFDSRKPTIDELKKSAASTAVNMATQELTKSAISKITNSSTFKK